MSATITYYKCILNELKQAHAWRFITRQPVKFIKILLAFKNEAKRTSYLQYGYFENVGPEAASIIKKTQSVVATDYKLFIKKYEPIIHGQVNHLLGDYKNFKQPLISLITPLYNTAPKLFDELLNSLLVQTYQNWEWVLVDDCSPDTECLTHIRNAINPHKNITLIEAPENGHISKATNLGIKSAIGDIIAFADHDDKLAPIAFGAIALASFENPEAKWFYSDEDFLCAKKGERHSPHLKSAFNPELLKTHNYITHLTAVRKQTLTEVGGLDSHCDGAQDYDLHLRLAQHLSADQIVHIPLVLYHWRQVEGSTAHSSESKSYTDQSGLNALNKASKHAVHNFDAALTDHDNFYNTTEHANYNLVSIIIPFRDHIDLLKTCISSIDQTSQGVSYEIILVDNGSEEQESLDYINELKSRNDITHVRDDQNFNFSRLINNGAKASKGDILLLLNNDIEATDQGWLDSMATLAAQPHNGAVGCKLFYPDGTLQHTGIGIGLGGYAAHTYRAEPGSHPGRYGRLRNVCNVAGVTAAALAVKKSIFDEVNGFDEAFQVAYNDVDFNLKILRAGYWNLCNYNHSLIHYESKSRGEDAEGEKAQRFDKEKELLLKRWSKVIFDDPFYHPLLTYSNESASFAYEHEFLKVGKLVAGRVIATKRHSLGHI